MYVPGLAADGVPKSGDRRRPAIAINELSPLDVVLSKCMRSNVIKRRVRPSKEYDYWHTLIEQLPGPPSHPTHHPAKSFADSEDGFRLLHARRTMNSGDDIPYFSRLGLGNGSTHPENAGILETVAKRHRRVFDLLLPRGAYRRPRGPAWVDMVGSANSQC